MDGVCGFSNCFHSSRWGSLLLLLLSKIEVSQALFCCADFLCPSWLCLRPPPLFECILRFAKRWEAWTMTRPSPPHPTFSHFLCTILPGALAVGPGRTVGRTVSSHYPLFTTHERMQLIVAFNHVRTSSQMRNVATLAHMEDHIEGFLGSTRVKTPNWPKSVCYPAHSHCWN